MLGEMNSPSSHDISSYVFFFIRLQYLTPLALLIEMLREMMTNVTVGIIW